MANYENTQDLKKGVLHRCGELTDGTSEYDAKVIEYLNRAYQATLSGSAELGLDLGEPWPWAVNKYNKVLTLKPAIKSITVTATLNSTSITFGSAPPENLQDWFIRVNYKPECYRISAHTGTSTSATLDGIFLDDSISGSYCEIFKVDYDLDASVLRLCSAMKTYQDGNHYFDKKNTIEMIDANRFDRDYPISQIRQAIPTAFAQIYKTNDMKPRVRFNGVPNELSRVEYNYIPVPDALTDSTSSIPIVPRDHRIALEYYASYYLCLDKNDSRMAEYRELARASLLALVNAAKKEKILSNPDFGRLIPRDDLMFKNKRLWWGDY